MSGFIWWYQNPGSPNDHLGSIQGEGDKSQSYVNIIKT